MPYKSPGRPPTISPSTAIKEWEQFKARFPRATKKQFAKHIGISVSRLRAIMNNHPSEIRRKEKSCKPKAEANTLRERNGFRDTGDCEGKAPCSGLMVAWT